MSSKVPSGGTKETTRSLSNLLYLTHGWKEQSSISSGSTKVRVRSGTPLNLQLTSNIPVTSDDTTLP